MVPQTGEVLALYTAPSPDPNRFIGGVPIAYYDSLRTDERRPLYNKALQGTYAPGSTWKLATSVVGLETGVVGFKDRMPAGCGGYYYFGNRAWKCWKPEGHGSVDLYGAVAQSCDVYFYQLGQRIGLSRLVAGGISLGYNSKSGIDVPEENKPRFPHAVPEYFNQKY